ncbi:MULTISPECIES: hypothetical protein [unclassified Janthinobacterium]|uniref:hypothetical protein n=1 Tax=unclassified Janthinobacterium TaxID=2610881 RepID=UPI002713C6F4|nr:MULTISPECIES: hypothetical protein [unclassified Janthinobacterium]MDO8051127.1 hypothetical protein [Janthinobacterium sp. SUN211]MDO8065627.1 hypothetical protein [Janthinobacterium sp. SUN206]
MSDNELRLPRSERTSFTEAVYVVDGLAATWDLWGLEREFPFFTFFFEDFWLSPNTNGDAQLENFLKTEQLSEWEGKTIKPAFKAGLVHMAMLEVCCSYAVQAMKANKNSKMAWAFSCEANMWLGAVRGLSIERGPKNNGLSMQAKKGAAARHKENREMKLEVWDWDEKQNEYKSINSAAEAAAGKLVPVTLKTVREWISEGRKNRRAGTAASRQGK